MRLRGRNKRKKGNKKKKSKCSAGMMRAKKRREWGLKIYCVMLKSMVYELICFIIKKLLYEEVKD